MAPEFAVWCQFQNAKQRKAHRKLALGITVLSNSSVSEQMKLKASRHSSLKSHTRYQRSNDENIEKKYEAINPSLLDDSSKHAKDTDQSHPTTPSPQQKQTNFLTPSSTIPPQPSERNIVTPSFDQNHSPQPPSQLVINIGDLNYRHASLSFAQSDITSSPQVCYSSTKISESDLVKIILKKIKEELGSK